MKSIIGIVFAAALPLMYGQTTPAPAAGSEPAAKTAPAKKHHKRAKKGVKKTAKAAKPAATSVTAPAAK